MARNRKKVNKSFEERIYIDKSTSSISYLFNFINQIKNVHFEKEDIDYGLMNIYGIGGKGKSALIEEFIIQLEKMGTTTLILMLINLLIELFLWKIHYWVLEIS